MGLTPWPPGAKRLLPSPQGHIGRAACGDRGEGEPEGVGEELARANEGGSTGKRMDFIKFHWMLMDFL